MQGMWEQPRSEPINSTHRRPAGGLWIRLGLLGLLLVAFWLRLYDLTLQDIWWDEARNLDVALRPLSEVATAPELDIHPPLYFWLLHVWLQIGGIDRELPAEPIAYMGRYLSVFAGVATVASLYCWGGLVGGSGRVRGGLALVGVGLGALSPFWLAESQETRMYTVGFVFLSLAGLALFYRALPISGAHLDRAEPGRWGMTTTARRLGAYVLLAAAALMVHYNVAFILVAWHIWWACWAIGQFRSGPFRSGPFRSGPWRAYLLESFGAGVAVLLLLVPIFPIALRQIPTYANPNLIVPGFATYLVENWRAYLGGYAVDGTFIPEWMAAWLWGVALLMMVGVGIHLAGGLQGRWQREHTVVSFLVCWVAGGLVLYYIAVMDRGAFNVRYAAFITPALYMLVAVGVVKVGLGRPLATLLPVGILGVGLMLGVRADLQDEAYFREDVAGVVAWLEQSSDVADVILVDQRYPFGFYWPGFADHPEQSPRPPLGVAPARYLFVDINTLDGQLTDFLADAERVFWVQWFESDTDPRRAVPFLLDQAGERVESRSFRGFSVGVWQLHDEKTFQIGEQWAPVEVTFHDAVYAVEQSIPTRVEAHGSRVQFPVVIRWRSLPETLPRRWKARVAVYGPDGGRAVQSDERLLNDRHLFPGEWGEADGPLNVYLPTLELPVDPGIYELRLLVYDEDAPDTIAWPHLRDEISVVDGVELVLGRVELDTLAD